jgi:hypothetical protein
MRCLKWMRWTGVVCGGYVIASGGCLGAVARELEVLFAPDAVGNSLLIPQSFLYEVFGTSLFQILHFLNG